MSRTIEKSSEYFFLIESPPFLYYNMGGLWLSSIWVFKICGRLYFKKVGGMWGAPRPDQKRHALRSWNIPPCAAMLVKPGLPRLPVLRFHQNSAKNVKSGIIDMSFLVWRSISKSNAPTLRKNFSRGHHGFFRHPHEGRAHFSMLKYQSENGPGELVMTNSQTGQVAS